MAITRQQIIHSLMQLPDTAQEELYSYIQFLEWKYDLNNSDSSEEEHVTTQTEPEEKEQPAWEKFKTKLFK